MRTLVTIFALGSGVLAVSLGVAHAGGGAAIVPEPSAFVLVGVTLGAVAWWNHRRK